MPENSSLDLIRSANLRERWTSGHVCTKAEARILNNIIYDRLRAKVTKSPSKLSADQISALYDSMTFDSDPAPDEPIDELMIESIAVARELITSALVKEGHPVPKSIDLHAKELALASAEIRTRAQKRLDLRRATVLETLADLGTGITP
jgi:hypothetical protein